MSSRIIIETPCEVCDGTQLDGGGGHIRKASDSIYRWVDCEGPGGSRREVTIDYEAATEELMAWLTTRLPITIDAPMIGKTHRCADAVVDAALGLREASKIRLDSRDSVRRLRRHLRISGIEDGLQAAVRSWLREVESE